MHQYTTIPRDRRGCERREVDPVFLFAAASLLALLLGALPAVAQPDWVGEGPAPIGNGQVEGATVNGEVVGAVHAVAPHPTDANILFVGSVNGGIWRTVNATAAAPAWTNLTPDLDSLSIGDIRFDPTDGTHQTLLAGSGRFSSFGGVGGSRIGLLRTTDGGANWTAIDGGTVGLNITGVAPRGNVMVVTSNTNDGNTCSIGVHRSTDGGASFVNVNNGLPSGAASALGQNPNNPAELYVDINTFGGVCGIGDGVYRSTDTGASWSKVSDGAMDALGTGHFEIAVGQSNNVFVSITPNGMLAGVFRSDNGGASWTAMDVPETDENGTPLGIHPGGQGDLHNSIAADPTDAFIVYVGGDRQGMLPNSIGAQNFSGRLFRGDASQPSGSQWTPLTHSGTLSNSSPHADSRAMAFDAAGNLIEVDDGGVYRRTSPRSATGDWFSLNGSIAVTEIHNVSLDPVANAVLSGNQDTGSARQTGPGLAAWNTLSQGDGGDTSVGVRTAGADRFSDSYSASQNLFSFQRESYDAGGILQERAFPALMFIDGTRSGDTWDGDNDGQFITPAEVNAINPLRLMIGATGGLYESRDRGETLSELALGIVAVSGGVKFGAQDNENILYVGASEGVYVATTAGTAPTQVYTAQVEVRGVALDPEDSSHAFAIEPGRVVRTTNTGGSFDDVTGNLGSFDFGQLRAVAYLSSASGDAIAVGATRGVYLARASSGFSSWTAVGTQLPNAPVFDLDYAPARDVLVAGTMGRGAFSIAGLLTGGSGNLPPNAQNDSASVERGGTVSQLDSGQTSLLANDTDPDMDTLVLTTTPITPPVNGNLTLNANGTFSYTHNDSDTASDSFVYQACDSGTPSLCDNALVSIAVSVAGCRTPNVMIPDATGVLTDSLVITDGGTLADLDVSLDITHTFVGDLTVSLRHDATGTSVTLIDQPDGGNCSFDDINATLDDAAANPANDQCSETGTAIAGTLSPVQPLAAFNGEDYSGSWTLSVTDSVSVDIGTLNGWCLIPTTGMTNDDIFADGFE